MKEIMRKIGKDLWFYVLWILVVIFAWDWAFSALTRIKTEEKVSVFIGSYSQSFDKYDEVNGSRPDYLKVVEINAYYLENNMFPTFLEVFGLGAGDILVLPESKVTAEGCPGYFSEISSAYRESFSNLGFYEADGKVYGLKIHDKETHESLISCISYGEEDKEENYYLFFNKKSLHIGDLADEAKKSDMDGAIKVAQKLLTL